MTDTPATTWIAPDGSLPGRAPHGASAEALLAGGWIGLAREGDATRVLIGERAVRRAAARTLLRLAGGADADGRTGPVPGAGPALGLAREAMASSWDDAGHPDPATQVAALARRVAPLARSADRMDRLADAAEVGGRLDAGAMRVALRAYDSARTAAQRAAGGCAARIRLDGGRDAALLSARTVLAELGALHARVEDGLDAAFAALVGASVPTVPEASPPHHDADGLRALRDLHAALSGHSARIAEGRKRLSACLPYGSVVVRLAVLEACTRGAAAEIDRALASMAEPSLDAMGIRRMATYHVGHECGRAYQALKGHLDGVRGAIPEAVAAGCGLPGRDAGGP
jgi:hypothetical protein